MIYNLLLLLIDDLNHFDNFFLNCKTISKREENLKGMNVELKDKIIELTNLFIEFPFHHPRINEYVNYQKNNLHILKGNRDDFKGKILNYQKQFYLQTNKELSEYPELKFDSKYGIDYAKLSANSSFTFLNTKNEFELELKLMDLNYFLNKDKMNDDQKSEFIKNRLLKIINKDKK